MTTTLDAIATASALLRQHGDPAVRLIGDWLAAGGTGPLMEALGQHSEPGYSARLGAALPERNRIIRELATSGCTPRHIASELAQYHRDQWPDTRTATECPHPARSREALVWAILRLRDTPLSVRQVQEVLRAA